MEYPKKKNAPYRFPRYLLALALITGLLMWVTLRMWIHDSAPKPAPTATINVPFGTPVRLVGTGMARYNRSEAKKAIAELTRSELPVDAADFWYYELVWRELVAWIRFDAEPDELSRWLQTAYHVCHDLKPEVMPDFTEPTFQETWWQPLTATRYAGQSCGEPVAYHTLVDMTQPGTWTIYLQIFLD